ncbi:unnamed protein product [Oppiella nova]|uniref:Uncharacterized protein n=1 Tax=Oppiella nova TaxID=334625 RepID=A0A7R9MIG9_9ACAR|nr:unnamed protein product [Oppiella nova]CAG2177721.1 unnamed protein product [Oppiella nova]
MILRHCSPSSSYALLDTGFAESMPIATTRRPLTVIFTWMLAKDKHVEKYRQLWYKKGFDVLTVKTSPFDLLMPPLGGQVVAKNLVQSLSQLYAQYNEIVVHAFSVGGYQFGLTLNELTKNEDNKHILNAIKGIVLDSMVFADDCAPGLSRAITLNPVVQPIIESSIKLFLKTCKPIVKYYDICERMYFHPALKYSGLFLYSRDDVVSSVANNEKVIDLWTRLGHNVRHKCWDTSTHVLHYRDHQQDYEQELHRFVQSLKLRHN